MSNRLLAYRVPPQQEFRAARELRENGHRAYVPRDLADKRRPPVARGYVFSGGKHAFARHVRSPVGAVTTAELGRLYAVKKPRASRPTNPYEVGSTVLIGDVPGVVVDRSGEICTVVVSMLGKEHLRPLHYDRLRPG